MSRREWRIPRKSLNAGTWGSSDADCSIDFPFAFDFCPPSISPGVRFSHFIVSVGCCHRVWSAFCVWDVYGRKDGRARVSFRCFSGRLLSLREKIFVCNLYQSLTESIGNVSFSPKTVHISKLKDLHVFISIVPPPGSPFHTFSIRM